MVLLKEIFSCNPHVSEHSDFECFLFTFSSNPQFLTSVCSHTLARTAICCLVAKPCPALLYSMDRSTLDSPWDFPSKDTGVGCHFLLHNVEFLFPDLFMYSEQLKIQSFSALPSICSQLSPN